jgi:S-adenosylmethionine/arginine decarboxylase-like enzyme
MGKDMNERIKEIAQTCWDWRLDGLHFDQEKFVEKIVRECADIAKHNVMNISTYSDAEFVSDLIHQNFGVEE